MLYIGADHRGYRLKESLKKNLQKKGIFFRDLGNLKYDPKDDYPDFAFKVAKKVSENPKENRGILICGSGIGVCIAANRFKNIRAGLCSDEKIAKLARLHADINTLCLSGDKTKEKTAFKIVDKFLNTKFSNEKRHKRRIIKIESKN